MNPLVAYFFLKDPGVLKMKRLKGAYVEMDAFFKSRNR
jgi:hypothetical protein